MNKSRLKILLIEDHHIMRRGLASLLKLEFDSEIVHEAANGLQALDMLENLKLDLVIMDISLPGISGLETARRIKQRVPGLPILILSMHNNRVFVRQALEAGVAGYILKDSMVEELKLAIDAVQHGKKFISPLVTGPLINEYLEGLSESGISKIDSLTRRELEVLVSLAQGKPVSLIAREMVLSVNTVYTHLRNIKEKLGLKNQAELVRFAVEHNLILPIEFTHRS